MQEAGEATTCTQEEEKKMVEISRCLWEMRSTFWGAETACAVAVQVHTGGPREPCAMCHVPCQVSVWCLVDGVVYIIELRHWVAGWLSAD